MPEDGKSEHVAIFHFPGMFGTVKAGGETIFVIVTDCPRGIRMMIVTDEVVIIIDIP